jgi:hypothetical protein
VTQKEIPKDAPADEVTFLEPNDHTTGPARALASSVGVKNGS